MEIKNIKCHNHNRKLKLTFDWPPGISEVQINEKLYTLQEYKKNGGYVTKKSQGLTTYEIFPIKEGEIMRENGDSVTHLEKTILVYEIKETGVGKYTNHIITFSANYPVPPKILCYVRSINRLVDISQETMYYLYEEIPATHDLICVVRTPKNERLHLFINEEMRDLYGIVQAEERGNRARKTG